MPSTSRLCVCLPEDGNNVSLAVAPFVHSSIFFAIGGCLENFVE